MRGLVRAAAGEKRGDREEPSDDEAIARVLDGDTAAFAFLVSRHRARIVRLGLSFFRDRDEAEDFAQDVFVKAYMALGGFKGRSLFSTWLVRIAYNTAINAKKRRRDQESLDPDFELPGSPGADADHLRQETIAAIREAMEGLSSRQALCVELFFAYDLKYSEISEITGFPVNTIKSHVFRAKRSLRETLGASLDMEDRHALR
ncbi:MAG: sigma-70 family RNA polymerase sigma factor [Spirochaetaceae bacterium]|nr:sigma-70 family RNA polymerase sigma factor [Spirochaetaceae bacterium]